MTNGLETRTFRQLSSIESYLRSKTTTPFELIKLHYGYAVVIVLDNKPAVLYQTARLSDGIGKQSIDKVLVFIDTGVHDYYFNEEEENE